jgi:hypothetical protein
MGGGILIPLELDDSPELDITLLELESTFSELDEASSELDTSSLEEESPWAIVFSISVVPLMFDDCEQANSRIVPSAIRYLFMFIPFTPS